LLHLDIHRQLEHSKRLGMIVMECEACGYSTQGYKRARLKKRLEIHLSKCTVATSCEVEQHQPTSPAKFTNPKEQPEHSHEDRDPPVHCQHESLGEKVHKIVATHVVPQERAHEEVSQVATVSEFDRTGVDKSSRVVQGPLVELDMKVHTDVVAVMYIVPGRD
jgi:hypothetical protein